MTITNDLIDYLDLIDFTLSKKFVEKHEHKFSPKFLKYFQLKLLHCFNNQKVLPRKSLTNYFTKKCGYSPDQVELFYASVDLDIYAPVISY